MMKGILSIVLTIALVFSLMVSLVVMAKESSFVLGDVDGDNHIGAADALLALQYNVSKIALDQTQKAAADVTGDNQINATDALCVLQYSVKKITVFPAENISIGIQINKANFPDDEFRRSLNQLDKNEDGWFSAEEINTITNLNLNRLRLSDYDPYVPYGKRMPIYSLKGIEYFTQLLTLDCSNNFITKLDLSQNVLLEKLNCKKNDIETLNIEKNINLQELNCTDNKITALNVSLYPDLTQLKCAKNQIKDLDVTNNENLTLFGCDKNVAVNGWVFQNDVVALNENNFPDRAFLYQYVVECDTNEDGWLSDVEISQVNTLDLNGSPIHAAVMPNPPETAKIELLKGIEYFTSLKKLYCPNNMLTDLDLSANTELEVLMCENNKISHLDLSCVYKLTSLYCRNNEILTLDLTHNSALTSVLCDEGVSVVGWPQ